MKRNQPVIDWQGYADRVTRQVVQIMTASESGVGPDRGDRRVVVC